MSYLKTFFEEKKLVSQQWEIEGGTMKVKYENVSSGTIRLYVNSDEYVRDGLDREAAYEDMDAFRETFEEMLPGFDCEVIESLGRTEDYTLVMNKHDDEVTLYPYDMSLLSERIPLWLF